MKNAQINIELSDQCIRFDHLFYLPAAFVDVNSLPERLDEILSEELLSVLAEVFDLKKLASAKEEMSSEDISVSLIDNNKLGFLAEVATPVRKYLSKNAVRVSWGNTYIQLIYADSLEELIEKSKVWAKSMAQKNLNTFLETQELSA
jgi:hypothetical protein